MQIKDNPALVWRNFKMNNEHFKPFKGITVEPIQGLRSHLKSLHYKNAPCRRLG